MTLATDPLAASVTIAGTNEAQTSGVSWAAVIGGALIASALSLILLTLGTGLGLSSISPWTGSGVSGTTFSIGTAIWLIVMQIIAFACGGYVAGRLRTKWVGIHTDEVYFRDTAHGFLVWAVGAVLGASLLLGAAASLVSGGARLGAGAMQGAMQGGMQAAGPALSAGDMGPGPGRMGPRRDMTAYYVDSLFRSDHPTNTAGDPAERGEIGRILTTSLANGDISAEDKTYVAQLVAARTGLSPDDATKRVDQVIGQAKDAAAKAEAAAKSAAEGARKAATAIALWSFIALLIGAFAASYAATIGGRARDAARSR